MSAKSSITRGLEGKGNTTITDTGTKHILCVNISDPQCSPAFMASPQSLKQI